MARSKADRILELGCATAAVLFVMGLGAIVVFLWRWALQ